MTPDSLQPNSTSTHRTAASHLTEEEINDVLLGLSTPATDRHLASCALCGDQLSGFRTTLGAFNKASLTWSEARSNSMPLELPHRRVSLGDFSAFPSLSVSAALAFVVGLALTVGLHQRSPVSDPDVASTSQPQPSAADTARQDEIASDNAMLAAISSELYRPTPSPLEVYEPFDSSRSTAKRRHTAFASGNAQVKD